MTDSVHGGAPTSVEVRREIDRDAGLRRLLAEVERRQAADAVADGAHDLGHLLRVARWTWLLSTPSVPSRVAIAAALVHDVVQHPKGSAAAAHSSTDAAAVTAELLPQFGFDAATTQAIADAVRDHSYRRGAVPDSVLGRALQDADRLDALGAVGIARAVTCGALLGSGLFDVDDPWADARPLDDRRFTLDHFFTKLLRLPATFHTEAGRREAERRAAFIRRYIEQLADEIGPRETDVER